MSQKAINIYTPSSAAPHIYAEDEAQTNRARFGGSGITLADNLLALTMLGPTSLQLASGQYSNQGYMISVPGGDTEGFTVDPGTAGAYRRDLLVAHFTRGGGNTADTHYFEIVKGTEAGSADAAQDPTIPDDDLSAGGSERSEILYRIHIDGTGITRLERVAPYIGNIYQ